MSDYPEQEALHFFQSNLQNKRLQIAHQWHSRNGIMLLLKDELGIYLCILYSNGQSWHAREGDFLRLPDIANHITAWAGIPEFE